MPRYGSKNPVKVQVHLDSDQVTDLCDALYTATQHATDPARIIRYGNLWTWLVYRRSQYFGVPMLTGLSWAPPGRAGGQA